MGIEINGLNLPHVQILAFYTRASSAIFENEFMHKIL